MQELTDMEIYMNNLYTCPSVGHADRHCDPTFCSVGLSYPYYSPIEAETPGKTVYLLVSLILPY